MLIQSKIPLYFEPKQVTSLEEGDISDFFSKPKPKDTISLQDIQKKIQNNSFSLSDLLENTIGLISLATSLISTFLYLIFLDFLGLPLNNSTFLINTFIFTSSFLVWFSSLRLSFLKYKLPFIRKKELACTQFIIQFLETDTLSFFKNIQKDLFMQLKQKNIQLSQPHIYNYINQSIVDLETHYNELIIRFSYPNPKSDKHSPFLEFLYHYEELIAKLNLVNDIQIINSDT